MNACKSETNNSTSGDQKKISKNWELEETCSRNELLVEMNKLET